MNTTSPRPRILLVGMMGSGKSTVGRALAERTGWPFLDNDELVERATGRTARQLSEGGEAAVRAAEAAALREGLAVEPPAIIGVAGGAVLDPRDRKRIREGGFVVWLRAPAEVLAARAVGAEHRPWLEGDAEGWFRRAVSQRDPLYAWVADLEVDTRTGTGAPEEVAASIVAALPSAV
ncbi:MAG: shikimate kinase [Candidatus Limnocylindria bacterium]